MDIDDPAEVPSIRADLVAAWGGQLGVDTYRSHLRSLEGTGIEPPGPCPVGVYDETNNVEGENSGVGDEANIGTDAEVEDQAPKPSDTNSGAENDVEDEEQILEPKEVPKPRRKGRGKKNR